MLKEEISILYMQFEYALPKSETKHSGMVWVQLSATDIEVKYREEIDAYPFIFGGVVFLGSQVFGWSLHCVVLVITYYPSPQEIYT